MAVETENVKCLMGWFADGGPARALTGGEQLVGKLAALVFQGDDEWTTSTSRADGFRDALREWFAGDEGREARFVDLADPSAEPAAFIGWFLPVVLEWERRGAPSRETEVGADSGRRGHRNPNHDGTPGTEYYRIDAATGAYVYAANESDESWLSYDQRRYSESTRDDAYHLMYRYDRKDGVYEWYDEKSATWKDQAWADARAANGSGAGVEASDGSAATWDENSRMFYRLGSNGVYEHADAKTPGDQASGCSEVWLSPEQARTRVMPIYLIAGWQALEDEPWAQGWYTLPDGSGGYKYLHSPDRTPGAGDEGWSPVPPAPPAEPTPEQEEEYAVLGFTLDEAAEAIANLTEALSALGGPEG